MKIVFICGSLEPGCDGVGDYTRRLSSELSSKGYSVGIIAYNDHFASQYSETVNYFEGSTQLISLRIPHAYSRILRSKKIKEFLQSFKPDWISLQFVPFSFNTKGLIFGLSKELLNLGGGWQWHIMFHELWVGMSTDSSKKHILWGLVQRHMIKSLIKVLSPNIIHTQIQLYKAQLSKLGFNSQILPLFSNIPLTEIAENKTYLQHNSFINLVLFGTLHPHAQVESFIKEVALYNKREINTLCLKVIGRSGSELNNWIKLCEIHNIEIDVLGPLPSDKISEVLQNSSVGITTTAFPMIFKSGSVAAMQEHSLPVICIALPWKPRGIELKESNPGIYEFTEGILETCLSQKSEIIMGQDVSSVAQSFLRTLKCFN
jgi:glycosyltransferase involved in cell wall biosynthesis